MTEQEKQVETRFASLEQQVSTVAAKVDALVEELKQQREDIRRLNERQDTERKSMDAKIDRLGDKIQNMVIAAVVGFGAIMFAAVCATFSGGMTRRNASSSAAVTRSACAFARAP